MRLAGIALALVVFGLHWPILADAGLLAASLHWLFGAVRGYDPWAPVLCWATGPASAWWVRTVGGNDLAGQFVAVDRLPTPEELRAVECFFRLYQHARRWVDRLRGRRGETVFTGIERVG